MFEAVAHVVFYGLAAAASPLVLTAIFLVIRSSRPRTHGIAFLLGFLVGTAIACVLGLAAGQAAVERLDAHESVTDVLTLLLGLALLAVGFQSRKASSAARSTPQGSRATAILAGLGNVRPAAAFSMAGLLGFGGPKRLVLTFLAMAAISEADLGSVTDFTLAAVYLAIATSVVSVPVGIVVVAGERAAVILTESQSWLTAHAAQLRVWLSFGIGAALVLDGLVRLIA